MPIYRDMNGGQLLRFLAAIAPRRPDPAWLDTLLTRFGLGSPELSRPLIHLSHGMKQKVGLVQALMTRAPVLVLDEPTAGLDPLMAEAFCETMLEMRAGGHAIFLSSHVLSEVERLCDRIALIAGGRLVKVASVDEIRREFPRRIRLTFSRIVAPPAPTPGTSIVHVTDREWTLDVRGGIGPILANTDRAALADVEVENFRGIGPILANTDRAALADVEVENFRLEDYILGLYERRA
jgi:ABC-2 type transport system ATP-binding protein